MILDQHFDRIVIISLAGAEERAERALRELRDKKLSDKAVIFRGIDGSACEPSDWWQAGSGAWGCMLSHFFAVAHAKMDGVKALGVFEDDAIWQTNAAPMAAEFLADVPEDWGQIYFGGQHRDSFKPVVLPGKPSVMRANSVHRTHAYAISERAMGAFLKHIMYAPDYLDANSAAKPVGERYKSHVDHQLERAHKRRDWPVYVPSWWLAGQGENLSHINGRQQQEQWWHLTWGEANRRMPLVICDREPTAQELKCLHFGKHVTTADPVTDVGVKKSPTARDLIRVMEVVAEEAIGCQRLPGFPDHQDRPEMAGWIKEGWYGPVLLLSENPDLEALRDFPVSHAIHHDWFNPRDPKRKVGLEETQSTAETAEKERRPMVHQVWLGPEAMSPRLDAYRATIERAFPGWEYKLWTEDDMPALALDAVLPATVLDTAWPVGMRSDIVRLEILRQHGGVYFDTDFEALRETLGQLFRRPNCFFYGDEKSGRPSNAMMAANQGHPFLDFYLRRIASNLVVPDNLWDIVGMTGPGKLAECLNLWVVDWSKLEPLEFEGNRLGSYYAGGTIAGFWQEAFYPYHFRDGTWATFEPAEFPVALAAHHWEGGWNREPA